MDTLEWIITFILESIKKARDGTDVCGVHYMCDWLRSCCRLIVLHLGYNAESLWFRKHSCLDLSIRDEGRGLSILWFSDWMATVAWCTYPFLTGIAAPPRFPPSCYCTQIFGFLLNFISLVLAHCSVSSTSLWSQFCHSLYQLFLSRLVSHANEISIPSLSSCKSLQNIQNIKGIELKWIHN